MYLDCNIDWSSLATPTLNLTPRRKHARDIHFPASSRFPTTTLLLSQLSSSKGKKRGNYKQRHSLTTRKEEKKRKRKGGPKKEKKRSRDSSIPTYSSHYILRNTHNTHTQTMENEQISLPSLIVIVVLGALIIRYLFFSPAVSTQHQRGQRPNQQHQQDVAASASRAREAVVERIQQMFPQVERRTVLWDLQRNGGNIAATTERILAGRLETVSFFVFVLSC